MGVSSNNFELFKMLTVNWGIGRSSSDIELTSAQYIIAAKKYAKLKLTADGKSPKMLQVKPMRNTQ